MQGSGSSRTTRFSDVCGSLDELKRLLREEQAPDPDVMLELLEDVRYMLGRMEGRLSEYGQFEQEAEALLQQVRSLGPSRLAEALAVVEEIDGVVARGRPAEADVEVVCDRAERIRDVANEQEQKLRRAREAAIGLHRLYLGVRGNRDWSQEEGTAAVTDREAELAAQWGSWLPPSPHRERILDFLARGRAQVLRPTDPREEPSVQFEDGGEIPLRHVRWSEAVRNFHPAGQDPHPDGRRHRGR